MDNFTISVCVTGGVAALLAFVYMRELQAFRKIQHMYRQTLTTLRAHDE